MKLHEVLEELSKRPNEDLWFRPSTAKGLCCAYTIKEGHSYFVPNTHEVDCSMSANIAVLSGDWEIVTPDEILNGK